MPSRESLLKRLGPSREKRHWVRLTRACNNHCIFCLDSDCQDGSFLPYDEIMRDIRGGLAEGATRVILSGGDPTIHPGFIDIIRASAAMGYRWIQAITNGRRFAYPEFTARALEAGLSEVTVSVHGHEAALHDRLTMVPGSFVQSVAGIRNLLASGKCHVSVDVVMNSMNIEVLHEIIDFFAGLGIREFDLLFIQPFGRAWENRDLLLERRHAAPIRRALRRAEALGCWAWTNRVPPEYLEGMEDTIQDPAKLLDDIGGSRELFRKSIRSGTLPGCRGEKCGYCVLNAYCESLGDLLRILHLTDEAGKAPCSLAGVPVKVEPPYDETRLDFTRRILEKYFDGVRPRRFELVVSQPGQQRRLLESADRIFPGTPVALQIHSDPGEELSLDSGKIVSITVEPHLAGLLGRCRAECERIIIARERPLPSRTAAESFKLAYLPEADMGKELAGGPDFGKIGRNRSFREMIDVPPCLSGNRTAWSTWPWISSEWFDEDMLPDPLKFASDFIGRLNRSKSLRCRSCEHDGSCRGIHVNYLRRFGYKILKPDRE
jgi:MoaA/NifB/PqqE/SkfB family radical SAM enzyme